MINKSADFPQRASPLVEDLRLFLFSASHHILNGPQERHAIAGGFLFADAGDVQKLIHAQGLALDHLAEGRVAEHHVGRNILLRCKTLAEGVERGQQLLVCLAEVAADSSTRLSIWIR